jgi:hypothetical protein
MYAKLTELEALAVHHLANNGWTLRELARQYGISSHEVWLIKHKRRWRYLWTLRDRSRHHPPTPFPRRF